MDAAAELGRNLVSKHQIQPEYGDEQADTGRNCRTRLARPNSQARTRTREMVTFPVQLTTSRIGCLTRLIHTLALCCYFLHINRSGLNHTQYYTWLPIRYVVCWTEKDQRNIYKCSNESKKKNTNNKQKRPWIVPSSPTT